MPISFGIIPSFPLASAVKCALLKSYQNYRVNQTNSKFHYLTGRVLDMMDAGW